MLLADAKQIEAYAATLINAVVVTPPRPVVANPISQWSYVTPDASIPDYLDGDAYNDAQQGSIGNCGLVAGIAEIAYKRPDLIPQIITDNGDGTYTVKYFKYVGMDVPGTPATITIDRQLPSAGYMNWSRELWAALLEKTYAIVNPFAFPPASYDQTVGAFPYSAMGTFVAGVEKWDATATFEQDYAAGALLCLESKASLPTGSPIVANHAYSCLHYDPLTKLLNLWNPWGFEQLISLNDVQTYFRAVDAVQMPATSAMKALSSLKPRRN